MRHIRTRRRFRFILIILLAVCLTLFMEARIEALIPQLKDIAVGKIEDRFDDKFRISIGNVNGGIFHPFVFSDIKIRNNRDTVLFPSIVIGSIRTSYRIWDMLSETGRNAAISRMLPDDSRIYINFAAKNNQVFGFVGFEGGLSDSKVKGYAVLFGKEKVEFAGRVSANSFDIELRPRSGAVRAEGTVSEDGAVLALNLKVSHLKIGAYDIVCDAVMKNRLDSIEGELETKDLVLNYRPFPDLKMAYRIARGALDIQSLDFGEAIRLRGRAVLKKPHMVDAVILTNNLNLSWFLHSLGAGDSASVLSGTLNGKFELKGPVDDLKLNARMEVRKGTISSLDFEYLTANLKGEGPYVRIEDSRITRESGHFSLAGEMDLRKLGKDNMFADIKLSSDDKAVNWDGWNTSRLQNVQEVRMKKKISEEVNIDFKKFISDEKIDEGLRNTDEVQVEYRLHPHDSLRMAVGKDKDFLGIEHKDKF